MASTTDLAKLLEDDEETAAEESSEETPEEVAAEATEEVSKEEAAPVKKEKDPVLLLPEDSKLLPGLRLSKKVDPPKGFDEAMSLKGTTAFLGGRKHDNPKNLIALGKKGDKWMLIVRSEIYFECESLRFSSTQTDDWLKSL